MLRIIPGEIPHPKLHQYLLHAVAPRPIAFASTVDKDGSPNLSPFSFFNVFGVNPTTLIFSPSRKGRDNTTKNTHDNVKEVPEVVINMVTYEMVNQASLASTAYPKGTDEFIKAGFTKLASEQVKPFRVKESPVQIECKVREVVETGYDGGAANLVICEVLVMHVSEEILGEDGMIDQDKIRLVGRLGGNHYVKAFGEALFQVEKPHAMIGIGIDGLPDKIRLSKYLTGNDLGRLGNLEKLPVEDDLVKLRNREDISDILDHTKDPEAALYELARNKLDSGELTEALEILMLLP